MPNCAAYIRVSTEDQAELSPESQLEEIKKYAAREGLTLLPEHVYADTGISGKSASRRPEFLRMIAAAKESSCPFSVILLWKYSRFARNQEESIFYKSILRSRCGIEVVSVTEPLVSGPFGRLIERIIEWMDEFYSIRLSQEVRRSMAVNAARGRVQSAPPFGYRVEDGVLVPSEPEAGYVRRLYSSFLSGSSLRALAREMNDECVQTRRGCAFESRTVAYLLQNVAYTGRLHWQERGGEAIIVPGAHTPIVDDETWNAAQKRLEMLKTRYSPHSRPHSELKFWAGGLVRCAVCGSTLVYEKPGRCKCNGYAKGRCPDSQRVAVSELETAILDRLEQDSRACAPLRFEVLRAGPADGGEIERLAAPLRQVKTERERLLRAYLSGAIPLDEFSAENRRLTARKERLEAAISAESADNDRSAADFTVALGSLSAPQAGIPQRHAAAAGVMERCTYSRSGDTLSIVYRLQFTDM